MSYISDMAKVLKGKGKVTLAVRGDKRKASGRVREFTTGRFHASSRAEVLVNMKAGNNEFESYVSDHVKATSFIYNSEESELSRMIKIADRFALRNKK